MQGGFPRDHHSGPDGHEEASLLFYILSQEAAVAQKSRPQLDSHDAEDEKDKEAEEEDVS